MPRIPEKNPSFRTKEEICEDLAYVLNAPISWGTQYAVIAEALWVWSEFDGKYHGCKHWSEGTWNARKVIKGLRHDDAVPKAILVEDLKQLRTKATAETVRSILDGYCIGVVITKSEDDALTRSGLRSRLPKGSHKDPWSRYREAGIIIRNSLKNDNSVT